MLHVLTIPCGCGEELTVRAEVTRHIPATFLSPEEPVVICGIEVLSCPCGHDQDYEVMVDSAYEVLESCVQDDGDVAYDNYIENTEERLFAFIY